MNSLCIKTNDDKILEYLKNEFSEFNMQNTFYSCNEFKLYKNIIIHYKGIDKELFYTKIATILSYLVIDCFEDDIIKRIILSNYFYFDNSEIPQIQDFCTNNLEEAEFSLSNREIELFDAFYNYIITHKSIVISGFINFRLYNYRNLLENLVDLSVNEFIIEREYFEFISLVKLYVNSQKSSYGIVHLVCFDSEILLLNENLQIIDIDKRVLNAKYLSDVSFSNNDYILNTLLNILPNKIFVHMISSVNLEFINTLKLIFESRIEVCSNCNICNLYRNLGNGKKNRKNF